MTEIGFQLYSDMLMAAVRSLKNGKEPDLAAPLSTMTEINLHVPALLPSDFCGDVHERLSIYKRLANSATLDAIDDMQEEMIDRFGKLPDAVKALVETHRLRVSAKTVGIIKNIKLSGQDKLKITVAMPDLSSRVSQLKSTIRALIS